MTKKATWSGYRGDGKPVIPCVPECMVEKSIVGEASRPTRTPTDYRKPGKKPPSSPRKHMKRIRNELLLDRGQPQWSVFADSHYFYGAQQQKVAAVKAAYAAGDLDLILAYKKYWYKKSFESVQGAIQALRAIGHDTVENVITDHHVDTFYEVFLTVSAHGYKPMLAIAKGNPMYSSWDIPEGLSSEGAHEIAMIAFSGEAEEAAVLSIIREREITDPEEVGKLVKEMLVDSNALASGIL